MPRLTYRVVFANGGSDFARSVAAARGIVVDATAAQAAPHVLPARIFEIGPNELGFGKLVEEIGEGELGD